MQPKVSVIIPVYNVEKYLRECLDSVVNQTLKDIEIICVDDGSTDNSLNILKEYAQKDDRINILTQKNQGSASARNTALSLAKGKYIGFIDSDDYISKNYFESLYNSAKKHNADICATNSIILCENDKQTIKKCGIEINDKEIVSLYAKSKIIITTGVSGNKIYRKQFLTENNIKYLEINNPAEDNYFTDIAVICANKIAINNKCSYYYVIHNNSQTQKLKTKEDFKIFDVYKNIENKISEMPISNNEKHFWQIVINQRKRQDFNVFYNTMSPEFQNEFKLLAEENLVINNTVVSLTSYPARIGTVNQAIESLLNQSIKADRVILWLAEEQFPNKEKDLPKQLLDLVPKGLTIDWCEDIKSYKKLIPTLRKYPDSIIVTADDDLIYDKNCIKSLVDTYIKYPNYIIANRAHYITFEKNKIEKYKNWDFSTNYKFPSFNMFPTGVGTVLYPPNCFYQDILNEDLFMNLSKNTDDIWFWAMAVLNGTKIKLAEPNYSRLNYIDGTQDTGLYHNNLGGGNNDKNIKLMLEHYPELLEKLDKDNGLYSNKFEKIFSVKNRNGYKVITILGIKIKISKRNIENIFSVRNEDIRKVITVLGIKFKFKSNKLIERKRLANVENVICQINSDLQNERNNVASLIDKIDKQENNIFKLETLLQNQIDCILNLTKKINEQEKMQNNNFEKIKNITQKEYNIKLISDKKFPIVNAMVYIPDYPLDYIQRSIVETGNFYEIEDLKYLEKYLNKNSVVFDIGANIGNHTVYWGKRLNVNKIYAIEPINVTYEKLCTNIKINGLDNRVIAYNVGVGSSISKAAIKVYDEANCGGSSITIDTNGNIDIITIDSLNIQDEHVDLLKIDTEGFEYEVLCGAKETIKKYRPVIYCEIDDENLSKVRQLMIDLDYKEEKQVKRTNYLFCPIEI